MKVLQIVKTNDGATWAFNQAQWLFEHGVELVTVLPAVQGGMAQKYQACGMPVLEADLSLPVTQPWHLAERIKLARRIVSEVQPDIIHCHFVTNIMLIRLAFRKSKVARLFQVPGPLHLENCFFRNLELFLAQENDYWAGGCRKTCDIYHKSGIPRHKVYLAYYGGYGGQTCAEYGERQGILHREYNIAPDRILVGMVGYFYKPKKHLMQIRGLKGHEDFIDAIALVREKLPSVVGIIIGAEWGNARQYTAQVKKYAARKCKDGIMFTGFRTDLKKIYRELDMVVHPSHSENLGGAAESLAAGVPTISTKVGGFPDIVINNETGLTVAAKSPPELAQAIVSMIENPIEAATMAKNGNQLVKELLDIENTGTKVLKIYNAIIQNDAKRTVG